MSTLIFHTSIVGGRLMEPYFLPPHLTGPVYHGFQWNVLPELLQDVNLQTKIYLWLMSIDAPSYLAVGGFLNNMFLENK